MNRFELPRRTTPLADKTRREAWEEICCCAGCCRRKAGRNQAPTSAGTVSRAVSRRTNSAVRSIKPWRRAGRSCAACWCCRARGRRCCPCLARGKGKGIGSRGLKRLVGTRRRRTAGRVVAGSPIAGGASVVGPTRHPKYSASVITGLRWLRRIAFPPLVTDTPPAHIGVLWRAVRASGVSLRGVTPISYPHLPLKLNLRARFTV